MLRLRGKLALRSCARSAPAILGLVFVLCVGGPASFAAARICHSRLESATPAEAPGVLASILLGVQAIFLLALIPRLGVAVGRSLPAALLRPFLVRPIQIAAAGTLGALLDTPVLFALPVFVAVLFWAGEHWAFGAALVTALTLLFLIVQTAALSQVIEQAGRWITATRRGPILVALCAVVVLGSVSGSPGSTVSALQHAPPSHGQPSPSHPLNWMAYLPGGVAAQAIGSARRDDWGASIVQMLLLGALALLTLWLAARLYAASEAYESTSLTAPSRRKPRPLSPAFASPNMSLAAAVFGLEWRCLLRDPASYLPLRGPAMLLLTLFLGWIAPNGGDDPILTLRDLVCMGGLFYVVLCQIQLLCNRFGNELGTAGLLLSFPIERRYLFLGKNAALLCLLLPLDTALVLILCEIGQASPPITVSILSVTVTALLVMTALGNVISVAAPFPIAKRGEGFKAEPDRSVIFAYCLAAAFSGGACWGFALLRARLGLSVSGSIAAAALAAIYVVSVRVAERALARRELRFVRALEGGSQ